MRTLLSLCMSMCFAAVMVTGYPSDGILQVEEEEEAQQDSEADTYTVEDDYELRQRYPSNIQSSKSHRPHAHQLKEAGNPAGKETTPKHI